MEDSQTSGSTVLLPTGWFERTVTTRASDDVVDAGGGVMFALRGGRVFEKVGVTTSTVFDELGAAAQKTMAARGVPGMADDP